MAVVDETVVNCASRPVYLWVALDPETGLIWLELSDGRSWGDARAFLKKVKGRDVRTVITDGGGTGVLQPP